MHCKVLTANFLPIVKISLSEEQRPVATGDSVSGSVSGIYVSWLIRKPRWTGRLAVSHEPEGNSRRSLAMASPDKHSRTARLSGSFRCTSLVGSNLFCEFNYIVFEQSLQGYCERHSWCFVC